MGDSTEYILVRAASQDYKSTVTLLKPLTAARAEPAEPFWIGALNVVGGERLVAVKAAPISLETVSENSLETVSEKPIRSVLSV
jgi:hypothetical protein